MSDHRVLIVAPHPDDELVGCCQWTENVRLSGGEVFVLYLTTGVPATFRRSYSERVVRRGLEARSAAERLGFTIVGMRGSPSRTLRHELASARATLVAAIDRVGADALWVPAYEGAHQDHDAANCIGASVCARIPVWEFAEYNFADGRVRSHVFPRPSGREQVLELSRRDVARKRGALALYASERVNLRHIALARECLRPLPAHDYTRAPHAGVLFYERFHWVPFRHARVDFTRSDEVCAALAAFTASWRHGPGPE